MKIRGFQVLAVLAAVLFTAGCASDTGDLVYKTEAELAEMEKQNETAHEMFLQHNFSGAANVLQVLTKERTVSRPLYQMELLSVLLMNNQHKEAHDLMLNLHEDLETLFDTKLEEKAQSIWHGEINKVFKGDAYERSTFYALMALSFIREQKYEDAVRCVKNGLLADADSNKDDAVDDYALLHYLGYLASKKLNNTADASEYWRGMHAALALRGVVLQDKDGKVINDTCFDQLQQRNPNVLLVIWAGMPPTVVCTGEYNEIRSIIRGINHFDAMTIAVGNSQDIYMPNNLGDIDYQATSRGGRLMDNVLADKAAAKKAMEVSRNVFLIAGSGLIIAGSRSMGAPMVGLSLMGAGAGCYLLGGTAWIVGAMMNPSADGRYWHNLPGQLYIVPLELSPGEHEVRISGFYRSDRAANTVFKVQVPDNSSMNIIHLPMMRQGTEAFQNAVQKINEERTAIISRAADQRMAKEIK